MKKPQYRFNLKTLRYELVRFSFWRAGATALAYASFGIIFFIAFNLLQNFLIETKFEKSLTKENKALDEYKAILASQLDESNTLLGQLKTEEAQLNEKLFELSGEATNEQSSTEQSYESQLITSDDESLKEQIAKIDDRFNLLKAKAKNSNNFFGDRLHVNKTDLQGLFNLPSIAPVQNLNVENFVSGFGVRINPYHKGNYHHDGIDIALPKGAEVVAAGNGRVSYFSHSNLEAGFGNYIEIDHGNGVLTRYAHLEKISVTWGQKIKQGQVIGLSGSSGGSVAPHLHYEVIRHGKNVDPLTYIIKEISSTQHHQLALKSKTPNQSLD